MRYVVILALLAGCAETARRVRVRPVARDEKGVSPLPYDASVAERFVTPDGAPCLGYGGHVKDNLIGWEAPNPDDAACSHDTLYDSLKPAVLELRRRAEPPAARHHGLVASAYAVGAWGRVVSRGSRYGDYYAKAQVVIDARSAH